MILFRIIKICKDYFIKNHIYLVHSNSFNIYTFIVLNNHLFDKKDETLFFYEINKNLLKKDLLIINKSKKVY